MKQIKNWRWWVVILFYMPLILPFGLIGYLLFLFFRTLKQFSQFMEDILYWDLDMFFGKLFRTRKVKKWMEDGYNK